MCWSSVEDLEFTSTAAAAKHTKCSCSGATATTWKAEEEIGFERGFQYR
jgi:hypothetical protein